MGPAAEASCYVNGVSPARTLATAPDQVAMGDSFSEVESFTKGVTLKSPDATRYRVKVANGGGLTVATI